MPASALRTCAIGVALLAAGYQHTAVAQVVDDPLAPIECYNLVSPRGVSIQQAMELCSGATTSAPGRCFATAFDTRHDLTTSQMISLCQAATSLEPFACFQELDAQGTLTDNQMIDYCATKCPLGPPPEQSRDPQCMGQALERTTLTDRQAADLCRNARNAGPVECFMVGEATTGISESQLLTFCAQIPSCQAPGTTGYGYPGAGGGY